MSEERPIEITGAHGYFFEYVRKPVELIRKMFRLKRDTCLTKVRLLMMITIALVSFTSCNKDCECDDEIPPTVEEYPSLILVNQNTNEEVVTSVRLLGYEFDNLSIEIGESQTFILDNGMPGGFDDINVITSWSRSVWQSGSVNEEFDFNDGDVTTITFKGCISFGECLDGLYLE